MARLGAAGFAVEVTPTRAPGHASEIAADAPGRGREVVFGLGGDGTLREIAIGLKGTGVALAILPGGTANVLALALGVPGSPLRAARCYRGDRVELATRELDIGLASGIPFLMMMTMGVDAEILRGASSEAKRRFGRLAVAARALAALTAYGWPSRVLRAEQRRAEGPFVAASNIPLYGGPFELAPAADPGDGRLDFAVFTGTGARATLGFAVDLLAGVHLRRPDVDHWQGRSARLEGEGRTWVQIDGDPIELELPVEIGLAPERLTVLLPSV